MLMSPQISPLKDEVSPLKDEPLLRAIFTFLAKGACLASACRASQKCQKINVLASSHHINDRWQAGKNLNYFTLQFGNFRERSMVSTMSFRGIEPCYSSFVGITYKIAHLFLTFCHFDSMHQPTQLLEFPKFTSEINCLFPTVSLGSASGEPNLRNLSR